MLLASAGAHEQVQTLLNAMWGAGWLPEVCGVLAEFGLTEDARKATEAISEAVPLMSSLWAIATAHHKAGRLEEARSTLASCLEVVQKAPDSESRRALLEMLGGIESAFGNREQAVKTYREALELTRRDPGQAEPISRLARVLWQAGDSDGALQAFRLVHDMAVEEISGRKITQGQRYTYSILAVDAGVLAGDMDQVDTALDLASRLQPWEQYAIVGAAIGAMVRRGDLERAIETTAIFGQLASASPVRIEITRNRDFALDESGCIALSAEKFAERGDWARAVQVASKIESGDERYGVYTEGAHSSLDRGCRRPVAQKYSGTQSFRGVFAVSRSTSNL